MSAPKKEPKTLLKNTSQGVKTDFPPEDWIVDELKRFGAIQTGRKWNLNLRGKAHTIFDKKRWNIKQARYDALEQSFLLGTRLLEVGGPYLCNFLPDQKFSAESQGEDGDGGPVRRLVVNDKRTKAEIVAANAVLVEIANSLQWSENAQMLPNTDRFGLNHTSYIGEDKAIVPEIDTGDDPMDDWMEAAEQAESAGQEHRQITITVASQYVDAILASKPDSDQHLVAVFMAAINMVHELGHTIYYHDLRSDCDTFFVGDDIHNETGHSFTAWLFDGWYPEPIDLGNRRDMYALKTGVHWVKWYRRPVVKPRAIYFYSVPLTHIQRLFDRSEWSKFDTSKDSLRIRQGLLRPRVPFRNGEHARTAQILDQYAWMNGYSGFQERNDDDDDEFSPFTRASASKKDTLAIDEDWADGPEQAEETTETQTGEKSHEIISINSSEESGELKITKTQKVEKGREKGSLEKREKPTTQKSEKGREKGSSEKREKPKTVETQTGGKGNAIVISSSSEDVESRPPKRIRREKDEPVRFQGGLFGGFRGGRRSRTPGKAAGNTGVTKTRAQGQSTRYEASSSEVKQTRRPEQSSQSLGRAGALPKGGEKPVPKGAFTAGAPARSTRSRPKSENAPVRDPEVPRGGANIQKANLGEAKKGPGRGKRDK